MKQEFDQAAKSYDDDFTHSSIGKIQRDLVWEHLNQALSSPTSLKVLELNCGTGEDAIRLAKAGHAVIASDISTGMLETAKAKITDQSLSAKVCLKQMDVRQLNVEDIGDKYDLVFSNFGGLNCIDEGDMAALSDKLLRILKPDGKFIVVLMPEFCLWESAYFLAKFNFKEAFRRKKVHAMANVSGTMVSTWYYSPSRIRTIFQSRFRQTKLRPIGLFVPPSYLEAFMKKNQWFLKMLSVMEKAFARFSWQSRMADHYYLELKPEAP